MTKIKTSGKSISGIYWHGFVQQGKNNIKVEGDFSAKDGDYVILQVKKFINPRHAIVTEVNR